MEKLFVLGHPIGHSKSPAMHNAAYKALGLDWDYGFMDCSERAEAQLFLDKRGWRACNVTMPWKPLAYGAADARSVESELAQGANVLVNWDGILYCDNTDGKGCRAYLQRCGVRFDDARVAVCGTGPTSMAIMHACAVSGAASISLHGRDESRTRAAVEAYGAALQRAGVVGRPALPEALSYDARGLAAISDADVIVDATPLGMHDGDPAPFDTAALSAGQVVFDVVYGHGETALVSAARAVGCQAYDGAGMLVAQAVETVRDIAQVTAMFEIPENLDLFAVMSEAAGFDL